MSANKQDVSIVRQSNKDVVVLAGVTKEIKHTTAMLASILAGGNVDSGKVLRLLDRKASLVVQQFVAAADNNPHVLNRFLNDLKSIESLGISIANVVSELKGKKTAVVSHTLAQFYSHVFELVLPVEMVRTTENGYKVLVDFSKPPSLYTGDDFDVVCSVAAFKMAKITATQYDDVLFLRADCHASKTISGGLLTARVNGIDVDFAINKRYGFAADSTKPCDVILSYTDKKGLVSSVIATATLHDVSKAGDKLKSEMLAVHETAVKANAARAVQTENDAKHKEKAVQDAALLPYKNLALKFAAEFLREDNPMLNVRQSDFLTLYDATLTAKKDMDDAIKAADRQDGVVVESSKLVRASMLYNNTVDKLYNYVYEHEMDVLVNDVIDYNALVSGMSFDNLNKIKKARMRKELMLEMALPASTGTFDLLSEGEQKTA